MSAISRVLLGVGIVALVVPALIPVQPLLYHDTEPGAPVNRTQLEAEGVTVIPYENLSERGKELYEQALRTRGAYGVPRGEGAPDFDYPEGRDPADQDSDRPGRPRFEGVAIERPNDTTLPEADEPVEYADRPREPPETEQNESRAEQRRQQRREQIARYDLMTTRTGPPPITNSANLVRLLSVLVGVIAVGTGGYLESRP